MEFTGKSWKPRRNLIERQEIIRLLKDARSATLGTVDPEGRPHLVPIVFAVGDGWLCTAVDQKPKSTHRLKRLRNIEAHPQVSVLVDRYQEDWDGLWWIRVDGRAQVIHKGPRFVRAISLLTSKYQPYRTQPPPGPVIEMRIEKIRAWAARDRIEKDNPL